MVFAEWMMTEDTKENFNNAGLRVSQWRAIGIPEECSFDPATVQNAEVGDIAFFNLHMMPSLI